MMLKDNGYMLESCLNQFFTELIPNKYAILALNPIIIVLNNNGYGTERPMLDGPFNDILPWNYYRIPEIIGHGKGFVIETEDQLEEFLSAAERIYSKDLCVLDIYI
jgi:TPP-dependent 2-oxoacid decarboxylase